MLSAPLLIGCDLSRLDEFTLNLLTNDEVIAIDQDAKGSQAKLLLTDGDIQLWVKDLADGTKAIGLFNLGKETVEYNLNLETAGLKPGIELRDVWRQKSLGKFTAGADFLIPSHGVILAKEIKNK